MQYNDPLMPIIGDYLGKKEHLNIKGVKLPHNHLFVDDPNMGLLWGYTQKRDISQEMVELAKLQFQTNHEKELGIENAIAHNDEFIEYEYNILSQEMETVNLVLSIYNS